MDIADLLHRLARVPEVLDRVADDLARNPAPDDERDGSPDVAADRTRIRADLADITRAFAGVAGAIRNGVGGAGDAAAEPSFGRIDYTLAGLADEDATADPMDLFRRWYDEAGADGSGIGEPNAMVLATAGAGGSGGPTARTVLLKGLDEGFTFYTNRLSAKGRALAAEPRCALTFPWYGLQRQVRVEGVAHEVDGAPYFATRPRGSQLGAWASVEPVPQSGVVADRAALEAAYAAVEARFEGRDVPCPPTWGGYAVVPERIEFWQGRTGRMHDRLRYRRAAEGETGDWVIERLAP